MVISAARTNTFGERTYMYVDVGSGIDTDNADYGIATMGGSSSSYGSMSAVESSLPGVLGDFPGQPDAGVGNSSIIDFMDYTNTSKCPNAIIWQNAFGQGTFSYANTHSGWNYDNAGAVQGLRISRPNSGSNYYYKQPTTFTLFGRGTP